MANKETKTVVKKKDSTTKKKTPVKKTGVKKAPVKKEKLVKTEVKPVVEQPVEVKPVEKKKIKKEKKTKTKELSYFGTIKEEMKKVKWPSKKTMAKYSIAVLIFIVIFGLYFYAFDAIFAWLSSLIKGI